MRSKYTLSIFILALFAAANTQAQSNFLPGYIQNQQGDTLTGLIDFQNWAKSPSEIHFQAEQSTAKRTFNPMNIKAFHVSDEDYFSANVQIETSPRETEQLQPESALILVTRNVFLKPVFKTNAKNLYVYVDEFNNNHFYIREDTIYKLLIYKKFLNISSMSYVETKRYVGQLLYYFSDTPSLSALINKTEYTLPSLTKLFTTYYQRSTSKIDLGSEQKKTNIKFGVLSGLSCTTLDFVSDNWPSLVNASYKPYISVVPALSLEFIENRNRNKWSLYNELLYSNYWVEGDAKDYLYSYHSKLSFQYLNFSSLLRYTMPLKTYQPFVNVGISLGYLLGKSTSMIAQSFIVADRIDHTKALESTPRY